jgi:hypothetical protein
MLILLLFFSLLKISLNFSSIIFPFKTISIKGNISSNDVNYNISHFVNEHYSLPAYITIKIGSSLQEIKFLVTNDDCGFKIGKARKCIYNSNYLSYYNRNLSSNFKYTGNYTKKNSEFTNGHSCSDNMEFIIDFSNQNNKYNFKDVGFYLGTDTNEEICGIIGLELNHYKLYCDSMNNIFESFKYGDIISKQNWIIIYTSKYEGYFIISPNLNEIIKNYDENKLFEINTEKKFNGKSWTIMIDKVQSEGYNETINKKTVKAEINNDMDLIEGDWDYYYFITLTYFEDYIKKSICKLEEIKVSQYYYFAIECDKDKFNIDDMKQFPLLTLTLVCFNSEFNFDYQDLFTETKHKIFFNIIFNKFISERWVFGKPVLRKYPMLINYEAQTIGYYNENWEIDYDKNNKNNSGEKYYFYLMILLVIILFFVIGVIFYFVGKNKNKVKKRRANELLDDNYDYIPTKVNNEENNKNDNFENNNIIND